MTQDDYDEMEAYFKSIDAKHDATITRDTFVYQDPGDKLIRFVNTAEQLVPVIEEYITPEYLRNGDHFTLFFTEYDWKHLSPVYIDLLSQISMYSNYRLMIQIIEDEADPSDEYLIRYQTKNIHAQLEGEPNA